MIEAQALYERAIRLEPHCFEAHFNLGNIHHDLGRFESALACYHQAVALNPSLPRRALLPRGHAREDRPVGRSEAALEGVPGARAAGRVGGAGEGVFGVERARADSVRLACEPVAWSCSWSRQYSSRSARASSACAAACRTRTPGTTTRA